jgi:hypothetical protein
LPGAPADIFALGCILYEARTGKELLGAPLSPEDVPGEPGKLAWNHLASGYLRRAVGEELAKNHGARQRRVEDHVPEPELRKLIASMVAPGQPARPRASAVAEALR